jgi:thiamine-phosphate pyrophosphorylase
MDNLRDRLSRARVYLVCAEQSDRFLRAALGGGVEIVQLRMKDAPDETILQVAARFRRVCDEHRALFLVNDRPDLVAAAGADGVHLGQDDPPVADARRVIGEARLIGLSTHTPAQVDASSDAGVDYIGVGPVNETPTKPGRPAVGLELVRYAAARATVPFFAIGGIGPANVTAVRDAGARRVAVVRALTEADDPGPVARALRTSLAEPAEARVGAA